MAGVQEENRLRIALLLLGLGVLLIVVGIGLGVQHNRTIQATEAGPDAVGTPPVHLDRERQARLIRQVLFILLVLMGIFAVSLYAFRLWSRRFRKFLLRKPSPPTPSEDVWAMHRLPEDALTEPGEPPPDGSVGGGSS